MISSFKGRINIKANPSFVFSAFISPSNLFVINFFASANPTPLPSSFLELKFKSKSFSISIFFVPPPLSSIFITIVFLFFLQI